MENAQLNLFLNQYPEYASGLAFRALCITIKEPGRNWKYYRLAELAQLRAALSTIAERR